MEKKNILFITIECLRKEHTGVYNKEYAKVTPNLLKIAKNSQVYNNYITSSSWTLPTFYSIFTSMHPNIVDGRITINNEKILPEILSNEGYSNSALTGGGWLTKFFGFDKGYRKFVDDFNLKSKKKFKGVKEPLLKNDFSKKILTYMYYLKQHYFPGERIADKQNRIAVEEMLIAKNNKKPFFCWIHYIETHDPYFPNSKITNKNFQKIWRLNQKFRDGMVDRKPGEIDVSEKDINEYEELYRDEIRYIDEKIGELIKNMEKNGIIDEDLYIFILGDHGQQFVDHGDFGHSLYLYQELINPPLIVYNKNFKKSFNEKMISSIDLAPSILDISNISSPGSFNGIPTVFDDKSENDKVFSFEGQEKRDDFVIRNRDVYLNVNKLKIAMLYNQFKIIKNPNSDDELFEIKHDPKEVNNIRTEKPKLYDILLSELDNNISQIKKSQTMGNIKSMIKKKDF